MAYNPPNQPERFSMPTYRRNVDTMISSVQSNLNGLSAQVKDTHVAFLNLTQAIEFNKNSILEHDKVMINGTMRTEFAFLRSAMHGLECAMRECMALTETENTEDKK
jgi:hypothetical protein